MDQGPAAASDGDGGRDGGAGPSAADAAAPREAIVACACNLASCARAGANGCDRPLRSIYAFAFDERAQLPGDG
jgi:hypothetical protein